MLMILKRSLYQLGQVFEGVITNTDGTKFLGVIEIFKSSPAFCSVDRVLWIG